MVSCNESRHCESCSCAYKLDEDRRSSLDCLQTPSVWLTLAALCLLQDEHVERLSSTQWARGAVNKVNYLLLTSVHVSEFFFIG
jgi:E3 ubiquitin-protein ligase MYCBP2